MWKAMAALEDVAATRRLGYDKRWQLFAAVGLALPFESRRCFYHSCESDLFQVIHYDLFTLRARKRSYSFMASPRWRTDLSTTCPNPSIYITHIRLQTFVTQALQQVEWRWYATIQLMTQLAACLGCWGYALSDLIFVSVSIAMKGFVVGVVSMQRLDDKRLVSVQAR